jgi:hypothetical protein
LPKGAAIDRLNDLQHESGAQQISVQAHGAGGIKLISDSKNLITLGHVGGLQVVHCHSGCPGFQQIFAGVPGKQLPMMALA